jgi:hypothetical protein
MRDDTLARYTGAFAAVGGGAWALANLLKAALDECRWQRCPVGVASPTTSSLVELLFLFSMMMVATAGIGLVFLVGRQGALGLLGAVPAALGVVSCTSGFALLWVAVAMSGGPVNPSLGPAAFGGLAVLLGTTLIGCVLLGVRGLPRAVGGFVLFGFLLLACTSNESMPVVVLVVASGMCWCGAGSLLLLRTRDAVTRRPVRRGLTAAD